MNKLSNTSKSFILLTIAIGLVLSLWQLGRLETLGLNILVLAILASIAQVLKILGPTETSSYSISWVVYGFTFAFLGVPEAILVILIAHSVEWLRYKYPWYIQVFNMANYAVIATVAGWVYAAINPVDTLMSTPGAFGALLAAITFAFLNHLLVGLVVKLARGQSFAESGVFGGLTIIMDLTMFGLGMTSALLWMVTPAAILLNLVSMYFFHNALKVPKMMRQMKQLKVN